MPEPVTRGDISNFILKRLSDDDFGLLQPHLETIRLPVHKALETRNRKIRTVYFMESGFASVVANGSTRPSIEVGLIGREGMSGLAVVLGADRPAHETYIQAAGSGLCLAADSLRRGHRQEPLAASRAAQGGLCLPDPSHADGAGQRPQQDRGAARPLAADGR